MTDPKPRSVEELLLDYTDSNLRNITSALEDGLAIALEREHKLRVAADEVAEKSARLVNALTPEERKSEFLFPECGELIIAINVWRQLKEQQT